MTGKDLIKILEKMDSDREIVVQRASMLTEIKPSDIAIDEYGKIVIQNW
jgi:hypothetical protein